MAIINNELTLITVIDSSSESENIAGICYGTCGTEGNEQVKIIDLENSGDLVTGLQLTATFDYKNTFDAGCKFQLRYDGIDIGESVDVYSGTEQLTAKTLGSWGAGQTVTFIYCENRWYLSTVSVASSMKFENGVLKIYNPQMEESFSANLGDKQLDFSIGDKVYARYGINGSSLYANESDNPYAQFGARTILGYEDELQPHLTAENDYLAMNDNEGEYFRVSRGGLRYKAKNGDTQQWLGISPEGKIGLIKNVEEEQTWTDDNFTPTIKDGEDAISVQITSSNGNVFRGGNISTTLTCRVYSGSKEITDKVTKFTWQRYDSDGILDETWARNTLSNTLDLTNNDVLNRATFNCEVEINV